jgi:hypothetical protein
MRALVHAPLGTRPSVPALSGFDVGVDLLPSLGGSAVVTFLTTLVVGGILIGLVPDYVERTTASVARNPIYSLLYGVAALLFLTVATAILFVTVIGVTVAAPLLVVTTILWSVGATIAYLAIADRLTGRGDGWAKPLLTAAIINGGLTLTGVGGLISLVVGAAGFGAVLRGYLG